LLRHLRQDHPEYSAKASAILRRVERGELRVWTTDLVIFETVFTLERGYRLPRELINRNLSPLLELPGIELPGKRVYRRVFDLYATGNMGFADCYHAALMEHQDGAQVLSFDRDFDRFPWITRLDC
jgi:predicted nucleic acid-binding protein